MVEFRVGQRVRCIEQLYANGVGPKRGKIYMVLSTSVEYIGIRTNYWGNEAISSGQVPNWGKNLFKIESGIAYTIKLCRTT